MRHGGSKNCSMPVCAYVTRGPKRKQASIDWPHIARAKMELNRTWRHKTKLERKVNKEVVRPFALFRMQNGKHSVEKLESMYDLSEQSFTQDKRVEVCYRLTAINTPTPLCFLLTQNSTKNLKSKTCSFLHTTHTCKTRTEKFCSLYSLIYCG